MHFDSLQFGGGAHCTVTFIGVVHRLIQTKTIDMDSILTFGGSSAGSILAIFFSVGFTPKEIFEELVKVDLEDTFLNDINLAVLLKNNGVCYGKNFIEKLVFIVQKKIPSFTIKTTFEDLKRETGKTLIVSATNLTQKRIELLNVNENPKMSVCYAIRLSISIPLLFQTLQYQGDSYIDGAWFKDIREVEACHQYFKKNTSLHFFVKIPANKNSILDITALLRGFFVESFWGLDFEKFPHIIETTVDNTSYDIKSLLYLFQAGIVSANTWIEKNDYVSL